jgi:hypothetical protein
LFSKLKSHELFRKGHPNHDASLTNKALITSARVGGHDSNPTNTVSSTLEFALSSLATASDEQYGSISNNEIFQLARKFCPMHKFHKEWRRSPRSCFECEDTAHFITTAPRGGSSTSPTSTTITTGTTTARVTTRRRIASGTRRRRRSYRRSCPERVLLSATSTSRVTTPPAQRRMRLSSASKVISPIFASWANLRETSLSLTLMLVMIYPLRVLL